MSRMTNTQSFLGGTCRSVTPRQPEAHPNGDFYPTEVASLSQTAQITVGLCGGGGRGCVPGQRLVISDTDVTVCSGGCEGGSLP